MDYGVITFTSTYGAIYAQKVLRPVADVLTVTGCCGFSR